MKHILLNGIWRLGLRPLNMLLYIMLSVTSASVAWAVDPIDGLDETMFPESNQFNVNIKGCKLENDSPTTYDPDGESFICADSAYTNGNLGSMYNELDLVPHKVTITAGKSTVLPQTYQIVVGADSAIDDDPVIIGYDAAALFDEEGCEITSLGVGNQFGDFGIGGATTQIVQVLTVKQTSDVCIIDYVKRLAITSSNITGSSNRSFVYSGGAESLPIPNVEDPFLFSKTMNGLRDSEYDWTLTKGANPTSVNFGNTCEKDPTTDYADVQISVGWTREGPILSGDVSVTTVITVDNPSLRTLKFDVNDEIFDGLFSLEGPVSLSEATSCTDGSEGEVEFDGDLLVVEPTGMVQCTLAWTDVTYDPELALNDIATGDIHDDVIGDEVDLGQITANAIVESSGEVTNDTANIADTEWIVGDNFEFEVTSVTAGSAAPLNTLVDETTDPNSVDWSITGVSGNGSATFNKKIYFKAPKASVGYLRDTATLTASDGLVRNAPSGTDYLEVNLSTAPRVELTISKEIPYALRAGEAGDPNEVVFGFDITGPGDYNTSKQITFTKPLAGQSDTILTTKIEDLAPGTYTVTENAPSGWAPTDPITGTRQITLSANTLNDCAGTAFFENAPDGTLVARAVKITVPEKLGSTSLADGWTMTLNGPGTPQGGESKPTVCSGEPEACDVTFDTELQWGSYTITETGMSGWDEMSSGECDFDVELIDLIAGKTFTCTFTNTQRGTVIIDKNTVPAETDVSFAYTETISEGGGSFSLTGLTGSDKQTLNNIEPGSYTVSETDPSPDCDLSDNPCATQAWDLTGLICEDDYDSNGYDVNPSSPLSSSVALQANIELDPGETVYCTYTNQLRGQVEVTKTVSGALAAGYQFDIREGSSVISTDVSEANGVANFDNAYFLPGNYALCEQEVDAGWTSSLEADPNVFYPIAGDNSYVCVPFTLDAGETERFAVENSPPPGGNARTIGYWRNWSGDCTNGNQEDKLGDALAGGVSAGDLFWPGGTVETCDAVQLIRKRNLEGENRAFDAAYAMVSQFIAYQLNVNAGADACNLGTQATAAQGLLESKDFDGTDPGSGKKKHDSAYVKKNEKQVWIQLASLFDRYNNNELSCPYTP